MEDAVMRQHIDLYVNHFTTDYGPEGEAAIAYLLATAERHGVVPHSERPLFLGPAAASAAGGPPAR
jgi:1,4-dihydroxy-6-naphthoate synthase